jgi:hypothetical protein
VDPKTAVTVGFGLVDGLREADHHAVRVEPLASVDAAVGQRDDMGSRRLVVVERQAWAVAELKLAASIMIDPSGATRVEAPADAIVAASRPTTSSHLSESCGVAAVTRATRRPSDHGSG